MRTGILLLENGVSGGGSFEAVHQLATHLDPDRFRVVVVFVNETHYLQQLRAAGVPAFLLSDPVYSTQSAAWRRRLRGAPGRVARRWLPVSAVRAERFAHAPTMRALERIVRAEAVQVVHVNNQPLRDAYGIMTARRLGLPCVSHLRSVRVGRVNRSALRYVNRHATRFIANSEFTRREWIAYGLDPSKIDTIHNAIAPSPVAPLDVRREWGIATRHVIGCVGNLVDSKGQASLLRAFHLLLRQEPECTLLLVGDGPHRAGLELLARELGIAGAVVFAGYDARAKAIIAGLDVLVLPSIRETFGRTLLEAMAAGTPIVAAESGGIPEVVRHEVTGLLTAPGDAEAMSGALLRLLRTRPLAEALTSAARRVCLAQFDLAAHIKRIEAVYDGVRIERGAEAYG